MPWANRSEFQSSDGYIFEQADDPAAIYVANETVSKTALLELADAIRERDGGDPDDQHVRVGNRVRQKLFKYRAERETKLASRERHLVHCNVCDEDILVPDSDMRTWGDVWVHGHDHLREMQAFPVWVLMQEVEVVE